MSRLASYDPAARWQRTKGPIGITISLLLGLEFEPICPNTWKFQGQTYYIGRSPWEDFSVVEFVVEQFVGFRWRQQALSAHHSLALDDAQASPSFHGFQEAKKAFVRAGKSEYLPYLKKVACGGCSPLSYSRSHSSNRNRSSSSSCSSSSSRGSSSS